jgi:hypothetical protein
MKQWILENALAEEHELNDIEINAKLLIKTSKQNAWNNYITPIKEQFLPG